MYYVKEVVKNKGSVGNSMDSGKKKLYMIIIIAQNWHVHRYKLKWEKERKKTIASILFIFIMLLFCLVFCFIQQKWYTHTKTSVSRKENNKHTLLSPPIVPTESSCTREKLNENHTNWTIHGSSSVVHIMLCDNWLNFRKYIPFLSVFVVVYFFLIFFLSFCNR